MTVISNLKRIARRPSLLLRGGKTNVLSDTDSEELGDSFESEEGLPTFVDQCQEQPQSPKAGNQYKPPPSNQELYGYGSKNGPSISKQKVNRRASTGAVLAQFEWSAPPTPPRPISNQQAERIKAAKSRRRNSTTTASSSDARAAGSKPNEQVQSFCPTSRRHSLTFVPNSQQPKTLYTIKPQSPVSPIKKMTPSLRSSLSKTRGQDSMRSVSTYLSHETQHSTGSQKSHGSVFSSTGWSVASGPDSPRKSPRRAMRPKLGHSTHTTGSSLYMPQQYESKRTVSSLDSSFSTTGWSIPGGPQNEEEPDDVVNFLLVEE